MEAIYGGRSDPYANCFWPEVIHSDSHRVLYQLPLKHDGKPPVPYRGALHWDHHHVRMPCSAESQYPVQRSDGSSEVVNRWELIETALLSREIKNSQDLEMAILSYNSKYAKSWSFRGLHVFFETELGEDESELFFAEILPKIIRLALQLPTLVPSSIPLLRHGQNQSLSMSQQQIACILANAFLCTFPRRNTSKSNSEYQNFPDINFNRLYQSSQATTTEKLKCICHYFRRVTATVPIGVVTFRRRSLPPKCMPEFSESTVPLKKCQLVVRSSGFIETDGRGLLQVDFANKMIGGGVLGHGCVQEEIRFMVCPELLVTRLFTEVLRPEEALFIVGVEQFSRYKGYASTFEWAGNYVDETPMDGNQRRQCQIVAIDALPFKEARHQFRSELMLRELKKAHVGFARLKQQEKVVCGVASGNWGCGAFNGSAHLKSLLQLMVCALAERPLVYFTFGDKDLVEELQDMYKLLVDREVAVGDLWRILLRFGKEKSVDGERLFSFIERTLERKNGGIKAKLLSCIPKLTNPEGDHQEGTSRGRQRESQSESEQEEEKEGESSRRIDSKKNEDLQQQKSKKNPRSPEDSGGGREKMARMSLADCLDSYFSREKSGITPVASVSQKDEKAVEKEPKVEEKETSPVEQKRIDCLDVVVQIDNEGGQFIEGTPPTLPASSSSRLSTSSRQTKLMDFFKQDK